MKTVTTHPSTAAATGGIHALVRSGIELLESVPYAVLALPLRVGAAAVFWYSAMTKLANWNTTIALFEDEYKVPILPVELAANTALIIELVCPVLLVVGLLTRPAALVLLVMTIVIQIFVYPAAWPTHVQWVAMLLMLLCRGPGMISIDHLLRQRFLPAGRS